MKLAAPPPASVRKVYRRLLGRFGPRGWWPLTPRGAFSPRYHPGRPAAPSPRAAAEICVGAILTQNTAWTNVVKALESLHRDGPLSLERIAGMPSRRLQRLIRSSGFFAQKASRLKTFARHALRRERRLDRWLSSSPLSALREELLSIRGVGPETADSMLLYAGGRPVFVVDAYTRRIGSRLGWFPDSAGYEEIQAFLSKRLPRELRVYQEGHALFVELAKRACRTKPICGDCPLRGICPVGRGRNNERS